MINSSALSFFVLLAFIAVIAYAEPKAPLLVAVDDEELMELAVKKITCPFCGSVVRQGLLNVYLDDKGNPLASIEELKNLGNQHGGSLGSLMTLFAVGNHGKARSNPEIPAPLDYPVPYGYFALELTNSKGSHYAASTILQHRLDATKEWNPATGNIRIGEWNEEAWQRFSDYFDDNNMMTLKAMGHFIAERNLLDPFADTIPTSKARLARKMKRILGKLALHKASLVHSLFKSEKEHHDAVKELASSFTAMSAADTVIGSAGEWALAWALLDNDGDKKVSYSDFEGMFRRKEFPAGTWDTKKTAWKWMKVAPVIVHHAHTQLQRLVYLTKDREGWGRFRKVMDWATTYPGQPWRYESKNKIERWEKLNAEWYGK